jgi:hypothetical protein
MGGLIEPLVVIDAERKTALPNGSAGACALRREEARGHRGHHNKRREVVIVGHVRANGKAGNFRVMPVDRESDGCIAQDAKVEGVVRVLPDVFPAHHGIFAEGLLEAGMKLIPKTGLQRS